MAEITASPGRVRKAAAKKSPAKKVAKKAPAKKAVGRPRKDVARTASGLPSRAKAPAPPRTPGNVPEIYDPKKDMSRKAWLIRRDGGDWIAAMGAGKFKSIPVTQAAVSKYVRELSASRGRDTRQEDLAMSIAFYENIIYTWASKAKRDLDAAALVLKARAQLDKIQRLGETESTAGTRTIVVAGSESDYVKALMAAALAQRQAAAVEGEVVRE